MYYYTRKEFDNYTRILSNSVDMRFALLKENVCLTTKKINSLAETLLYNKDVLDEMTIDEIVKDSSLVDENSGNKLRDEICVDIGKKFIKENTYRAIIFAFKYSGVKNFFYGQYRKFLPEYDFDQINASDKTKAFFDATMKELDRLDDAISNMSCAVDIDEIPYKYLEYLASLIGYENEDKNLVKDYVFRDLIKNMIEVYRVKGTNYSFELFLTFLGFDVVIKEYWFDRRFYYKKENTINEFTKATSKERNTFNFYLAPTSPEEYIPSDLTNSYSVFKNEIKGTMDLNMFNKYLRDEEYTLEQLLGITDGFDDPYTYFKTNVVEFDFSSFKKESEQEVSEDDIKIINRIFEFLLPIFIKKQYMITINDWTENVNPDPDLNDDWANSFFLFADRYHTDKTIDISYEECKGFDPIYERSYRWDEDIVYNKGAIVIYDNSIDFEIYKSVDLGDIIAYNDKYYVYVGSGSYMVYDPESDYDDYVLLPSTIPDWTENMIVHNNDFVRYEGSCWLYRGGTKLSTISPDQDMAFKDVGNISTNYPVYYECNTLIEAYDKYNYVEIGQSEDPTTHEMVSSYVYSRINYNTDNFDNLYNEELNPNGPWVEFGEKSIADFEYSTYNLITGKVYRYDHHLYVYEGTTRPAYTNPLNDPNFKLLTRKRNSKSTPDQGEIWDVVDFASNEDDFSVLDRLILGENLTEKQALQKISKMFESVCITSEKAERWPDLKGKYIYLDFYGNTHYEQGAEAIECIVCDENTDYPFTLQEGQVIKYHYNNVDNYLYCYNATNVSGTDAIENVIDNNNSQFTALIEDNWATSNYDTSWKLYIPVNYKTIKIKFTGENPDFASVCDDIKTVLEYYHIIDDGNITGKYVFEANNDEKYFRIYSKLDEEFDEIPYIKIQYDFLKDLDTVPCIEDGQDVSPLYGVDPNNAYKIFPSYFTSPRYRYDFQSRSLTWQALDFANRGNYITEFYPSTKFVLKRILRREVFNPVYDNMSILSNTYKMADDFAEEKRWPKLDSNFSFKDNQQKCYEDYYQEKGYVDYDIDLIDDNKICVLQSKALASAFYPGEKVLINYIDEDNIQYFHTDKIVDSQVVSINSKNYFKLTLDNTPDFSDFSYGLIRKFDYKEYTINSVSNDEIKMRIFDVSDQPFIVKPTIDDTVETYKDLVNYLNPTENLVVEIEKDETNLGKSTVYKYIDGEWTFIPYSKVLVCIENSDETIEKECDVLSSETSEESDIFYNTITINHPEILDGFISGKVILCKDIWHIKDNYEFMNEYLLAGKTVYDFNGVNTIIPKNNNLLFDGTATF